MLFLKGLDKYFKEPINNKKIAKFVGKNIKPNHIRFLYYLRYIKGKYLRSIKKRSRELNMS